MSRTTEKKNLSARSNLVFNKTDQQELLIKIAVHFIDGRRRRWSSQMHRNVYLSLMNGKLNKS